MKHHFTFLIILFILSLSYAQDNAESHQINYSDNGIPNKISSLDDLQARLYSKTPNYSDNGIPIFNNQQEFLDYARETILLTRRANEVGLAGEWLQRARENDPTRNMGKDEIEKMYGDYGKYWYDSKIMGWNTLPCPGQMYSSYGLNGFQKYLDRERAEFRKAFAIRVTVGIILVVSLISFIVLHHKKNKITFTNM